MLLLSAADPFGLARLLRHGFLKAAKAVYMAVYWSLWLMIQDFYISSYHLVWTCVCATKELSYRAPSPFGCPNSTTCLLVKELHRLKSTFILKHLC